MVDNVDVVEADCVEVVIVEVEVDVAVEAVLVVEVVVGLLIKFFF